MCFVIGNGADVVRSSKVIDWSSRIAEGAMTLAFGILCGGLVAFFIAPMVYRWLMSLSAALAVHGLPT